MNAIFVGAKWCATCKPTFDQVQRTAKDLGVVVEYRDVEDWKGKSIYMVPVLVLDGNLYMGSAPSMIQSLREQLGERR